VVSVSHSLIHIIHNGEHAQGNNEELTVWGCHDRWVSGGSNTAECVCERWQ